MIIYILYKYNYYYGIKYDNILLWGIRGIDSIKIISKVI